MHVHMTGIIWPWGGRNVSISKRREIGREKAGMVKHSGFRNAQCPTCASAHRCARVCTPYMQIWHHSARWSRISLVAHLFKLLKLFFRAVILLHFHFLVPSQNHHWFPFQQSFPVHQIAPPSHHLHPSSPGEKINSNVWTFDGHTICVTSKGEKIWSNFTYIRVFICNHLIIWAFLLRGFWKEKTSPQSEEHFKMSSHK